MPSAPLNNPTFNKTSKGEISKGYYSRVLFTYCPYTNSTNFAASENWVASENFNGVNDLLSTYPQYCHGNPSLHPGFWRSGKTIRLRGTLLANREGRARILNMRFGLFDMTNNGNTWLAIQNAGGDHYLVSGIFDLIPIEFEVHMQSQDGSGLFSAQGYYKSCGNIPDVFLIGGAILDTFSYTPVWSGNQYCTSITWDGISIGNFTTMPSFNFYGSNIPNLYLSRLIIEELA